MPHGRAHDLQDTPQTPLVDLNEALEESGYSGQGLFRWGGGGETCRLVCGHLDFDKDFGNTPMQYLTQQRMREACRLLRMGVSLGDVSDRVGYRSEAAFSRNFKNFSGSGPGAYRRAHLSRSGASWQTP